MTRRARRMLLGATGIALLWSPAQAAAQVVRVSGVTTVRYVELRTLERDSVAVEQTTGDGFFRRSLDGRLVRCPSGAAFCRLQVSGPTVHALPTVQDLTLNGWGIGEGIRVHARLRARAAPLGEGDLWPLSDDAFDALAAYVEIQRDRFSARVGRDWKATSLGYYNFDGASVRVRALEGLTLDAWGGWSLAPGLNESRSSGALEAIEPFAPDDRGVLLGLQARWRPTPELMAGLLYQREIRGDRASLYSERAGGSLVYRSGRVTVSGSMEADLVGEVVNEAELEARFLPTRDLSVGAFVRRHRPFFELWTIWGAFSPVGFHEVGTQASWRLPEASLRLGVRGSWREYAETDAGTSLVALRSDGWRLGASADLDVAPDWRIEARYGADIGFGAALSEGSIHARWDVTPDAWAGLGFRGFQRVYEFRIEEGTVLGLSLDGGYRLSPRIRATGSLALYRHAPGETDPSVDWNQLRGSLRVAWTVGPEPGMSAVDEGGGA